MNKSKKSNFKYKKRPKNQATAEDRNDIMKERPGKNDITWYGSDVLINAAGRHNFTNPLGKPIDWVVDNSGTAHVTLTTDQSGIQSVPGVMGLDVECGIGFCDNAVAPGNVFMRNIYSFVRHANAGHTNYNAPDLGLYFMAVDQVHMLIEHLVRIYGVARTYSSLNRYAPAAFLKAMGVDPEGDNGVLYKNLASIRSNILNLMVKAGTLLVPSDLKFIARHKDLMRYIYSDGSTSKTQTYVFRPGGYKIFREVGSAHTGGYLEYVSMSGEHTIGDWITAANYAIDAIINSEDMNIMSGDILKTYGKENCYQFAAFSEDYTVVPVYNPEMLLEIHNCVPVGTPVASLMDIYQDPDLNIIKYTPMFQSTVPYQNVSPIIDMPVEVPTPEQVMIATRFATMGSVGYNGAAALKYRYVPTSMGSEVVTLVTIYKYTVIDGNWSLVGIVHRGAVDESSAEEMRFLALLSSFDWHMGVKLMKKISDTEWEFTQYYGEMENYTVFTEGDLQKLHDTALIGEFAVPLMAVVGFKSNSSLEKPV